MGYKNKIEQETNPSNNSSSLSEDLLFATMCIIGLPVDVYVMDGSVYSGIFYTASVEKDYGIVLKKAKMTQKGKSTVNVAIGAVIETLVILMGDLVQVVAKGVQLPTDDIAGNFAGGDVEAVVGTVYATESQISEARRPIRSGMNKRRNQKRISVQNENGYFHGDVTTKAKKGDEGKKLLLNDIRNAIEVGIGKRDGVAVAKIEEASVDSVNGRQAGDERSQGEQDSCTQIFELYREENAYGVQGSSSNLAACQGQVIPTESRYPNMSFKHPNGASPTPRELDKPDNKCHERPTSADTYSLGAAHSSVSTSSNPVTGFISGSCCTSSAASTEVVSPQSSQPNKSTKEFKLNPGAKIFLPSFANPISATPSAVPTVASMAYMPNNSPVLPVAAGQSEVGISPYVPHSSVPAKFAPYGSSAAQFSQPIVRHVGSRTRSVRYAGQYPVQTGPAYDHPNSQAVMVGRLGGQLLDVQPVSNDLVQGVAAISPVSVRPALTQHQSNFTGGIWFSIGGSAAAAVTSPLVFRGLQPFPVPSNIPVLQPPIPANGPIPVPGSTVLRSTKFP